MGDLVIKTHNFELAKKNLREFSQKEAKDLQIKTGTSWAGTATGTAAGTSSFFSVLTTTVGFCFFMLCQTAYVTTPTTAPIPKINKVFFMTYPPTNHQVLSLLHAAFQ